MLSTLLVFFPPANSGVGGGNSGSELVRFALANDGSVTDHHRWHPLAA